MKTCSGCNSEKDLSFFVKSKVHRDGYHGVCKPCRNEQRRGRRNVTPEQNRDYNLKRNYGLYQCDIDEILAFQGYRCAICHVHEDDGDGRLFVDHCHETGEVRGMLCNSCNSLLGHARDSEKILQEATNYLKAGY